MKIGFITANLDIHGVAHFTLNVGQSLQAEGHDVAVIAIRRGEWWPRLTELEMKATCLAPKRWESVASHVQRLARWLIAQSFDLLVVNVGSIHSRPLQLCLHLLPDTVPILLVLHNDEPVVYALAAINSAVWNCAVGVSPKVQQAAQARFPQKAIHWIPHGIALPTPEQLRQRMGWRTPLRLLFVGRLEDRQKGIFRLPAILRGCRDQGLPVRLTVVGDGPDRVRLAQLCQMAGIADLVDLVGFQASEIVFAQMRAHHLLLLPSNFEGLGLVIQEAQANGCVPIASCLPGVTDTIIANGVNGKLVEPTDTAGFVTAIRNFLAADKWQQCSQAAIDQARQHYAIGHMMEQYVALFNTLRRGAYSLPVARSSLCSHGAAPFIWRDYLPQPLRKRLWSS